MRLRPGIAMQFMAVDACPRFSVAPMTAKCDVIHKTGSA